MTNIQIGAQMYSLRDRCQDEATMLSAMKQLKAMGYNICQLSGYNTAIPAERLRDMLQESGLQCVCTHTSFDLMQSDIDKVIRDHKTIGCAYPGIGGLPGPYHDSPEGYREFAKKANALAKIFADNGMHFIYHHHAFEFHRFAEGVTGLEVLYDEFCPEMQFELDVYWVQMGGASPYEWIEKVKGRMDIIHFKEMNGNLANQGGLMTPIGQGNINWTKIMKTCDDTGVTYALIEQDNAVETDSLECMRQSIDYLKGIGGRF
ncbi:MAG: sugar phosphate isomerase/epimerase [Clostridia bacterium]|nr:sugar phosphate isomerase/epimerase [Clostridia bacterium]